MKQNNKASDYQLLDSGHGRKIEQFGDKIIVRPSSQCIWKPRLSPSEWKSYDAEFLPSGKQGEGKWQFNNDAFETWQIKLSGAVLELRLQSNGQVGLFPEHASYLDTVVKFIRKLKEAGRTPSVLNLFAYTGLASVVCLREGAKVCHVDLSKKALTWATTNFQLNGLKEGKFRLICDDAIKFLEREVARENSYDIVIADPPSFSRTAKNSFWKVEDILGAVSEMSAKLLVGKSSLAVISCHDPGLTAEMIRNVMLDALDRDGDSVIAIEMGLKDKSDRVLSAGSLAIGNINSDR